MSRQEIIQHHPQRSSTGGAWRRFVVGVGLVAGLLALLVVALVLVAAWPVLRDVGRELAAHAQLIARIVLVALLVAAFAGLRVLLSGSRWARHTAERRAFLELPGGQPIHMHDARDLRVVERVLGPHWSVEQTRAAVPPNLSTYSPRISSDTTNAPALPEPPATTSSTTSTSSSSLRELHQRGIVARSGNSLYVGDGVEGKPLYVEMAECGFVGVGGMPRVGKSTQIVLLVSQMVLMGWHVFVCDPHVHKESGLMKRMSPMSGRFAMQAGTPEEIVRAIRTADKIGRRRINGEDSSRIPVVLVIDEFTNLVWRGLLPDDVLALLPSMAIEYAGVGVHGVVASHDFSKASLGGDLGAALRRAVTHRLILRMDEANAEFLLPSGAGKIARQVPLLDTGRALYWSPEGPQFTAIPWMSDDDLHYAAEGVPPRPYEPLAVRRAAAGLTSTSSSSSSTTSSSAAGSSPLSTANPQRAAAPTTTLPPLTIAQQLVELLERRSWLTARECADELGARSNVVGTELAELHKAGTLQRRPCGRANAGGKWEYATAQN